VQSALDVGDHLPGTEASRGQLVPGQEIAAKYTGSQLLPPKLTDFITDVRRKDLIEHTDQTIQVLRAQIENAGDLMKSMQTLIGDPKLQADVKRAVSNVSAATDKADRSPQHRAIQRRLQKVRPRPGEVQHRHPRPGQERRRHRHLRPRVVDKTGTHVDEISRHLIRGRGRAWSLSSRRVPFRVDLREVNCVEVCRAVHVLVRWREISSTWVPVLSTTARTEVTVSSAFLARPWMAVLNFSRFVAELFEVFAECSMLVAILSALSVAR